MTLYNIDGQTVDMTDEELDKFIKSMIGKPVTYEDKEVGKIVAVKKTGEFKAKIGNMEIVGKFMNKQNE